MNWLLHRTDSTAVYFSTSLDKVIAWCDSSPANEILIQSPIIVRLTRATDGVAACDKWPATAQADAIELCCSHLVQRSPGYAVLPSCSSRFPLANYLLVLLLPVLSLDHTAGSCVSPAILIACSTRQADLRMLALKLVLFALGQQTG
jgi:hypothetical protein